MNADQIRSLQPALATLLDEFRPYFPRESTFGHWECYLAGLMADLKRKSIEPIALAAGVPVRTLQEFLSFLVWDEQRVANHLQRLVVDKHDCDRAIGVLDSSGHPKQGDKTPGVQRQWCGERGKVENCVVGQHLLYTDNDPTNPFTCMLASDLYLPKSWAEDRERCREAKIPDDVKYLPKWQIAIEQLIQAIGNGIRFSWVTFDEEYGQVPMFWVCLDALGQRGIGEVPRSFLCWPTRPSCRSLQRAHAAKRVDNVCRYSPVFTDLTWRRVMIKETTRGDVIWEVKAARVHLLDTSCGVSEPSDRQYWLIVARNPATGEYKYFVSNAAASVSLISMLRAAFARWQVEKWFERAKQEAGLGAFEVRTYKSLIRHWLCSRLVMYFLAAQTQRLRGEKSEDHTGTGGRRSQHTGNEDMAELPRFLEGNNTTLRVLSTTQ
jgi:SRSO17 transposase